MDLNSDFAGQQVCFSMYAYHAEYDAFSQNSPLACIFLPDVTSGCTYIEACNYNEDYMVDDGSCILPWDMENPACDCEGN